MSKKAPKITHIRLYTIHGNFYRTILTAGIFGGLQNIYFDRRQHRAFALSSESTVFTTNSGGTNVVPHYKEIPFDVALKLTENETVAKS